MTILEFSNEFDITYNNATNSAPGIDLYEKSVYLTRAQLELVNNYFNPLGNKYKKGFEQSSKRRNDLRELIRPGVSTTLSTSITEDDKISPDSQVFRIKSNVYIILQEKVKLESTDPCLNNTYLKVVPKTHDEFNIQEDNPFKKPDKREAWRLDLYSKADLSTINNDGNKIVELVSPYKIIQYKYRYIVYPSPIILVNLLNEYPSEELTIDGITVAQTCKLSESIHREIINRAVELATVDYKPASLQSRLAVDNRNE